MTRTISIIALAEICNDPNRRSDEPAADGAEEVLDELLAEPPLEPLGAGGGGALLRSDLLAASSRHCW